MGPSPDAVSVKLMEAMGLLLPSLWNLWADKATVYPRLQYLYTKRQAIEVLEGQLRNAVQFSLGPLSQSDGQKFDHLKEMWGQVDGEIKELEARASANRGAAIGVLSQTAPVMPGQVAMPSLLPDANSERYRGNPQTWPWRRW